MTELNLQIIASTKLLSVATFATLYGLGGMFLRQQLRRISGSMLYTASIIGFSMLVGTFSWWFLLTLPIIYGSLSLGYGSESVPIKVLKRSYCGLAYSLASLPVAIVTGSWVLYILHTVLCVGMSITLGVLNPTNARYEETLLGTTIILLPLYMV